MIGPEGSLEHRSAMSNEGPLAGVRVLEIGGIGAVPFACTLLSDCGADVVRVDRPGIVEDRGFVLGRGRRVVELDLRDADDRSEAMRLADEADVVVEGFRPGVLERLGLGPDVLAGRNPRVVVARLSGWGQDGPYAPKAGHDINFIGLSGALASIGPSDGDPAIPLNLVGDFGGGAMVLLFGILAALHERHRSGRGQVIDASMSDGCVALMGIFPWMRRHGRWTARRGRNWMDGGAHYYNVYACRDGRHVAIGAIEPAFYANLLAGVGLESDPLFTVQDDPARWPAQKARLAEIFRRRTRDEWCAHFEVLDACVTPVLALDEVAHHPHHIARRTVTSVQGIEQPSPVPRFSRTPARIAQDTHLRRAADGRTLHAWSVRNAVATPSYR